jgi:ribosomal protein L30/L7E
MVNRSKHEECLRGLGLTQNHDKTNRQVRQVRQGIRVAESFCVSPEDV